MRLNDTDKILGVCFMVAGMLAAYMVNPQLVHSIFNKDKVAKSSIRIDQVDDLAYVVTYTNWMKCIRKDKSTFASSCTFRIEPQKRWMKRKKIKRSNFPNFIEPKLVEFDEEYEKLKKYCKNLTPIFSKNRTYKCTKLFFANQQKIENIQKKAKDSLRTERVFLSRHYKTREKAIRPFGAFSDMAYSFNSAIRDY